MKKILLAMLLVAAVTAVAQTSSAPAQTQTPAQPGAAAPQQNPSQPAAPQQKKEIKDPATGKVLRKLSTQVGTLQVTDVDDVSAVAKPVQGAGFRVGDVVKTQSQ